MPRPPRRVAVASFAPSEAWIDAFAQQCTPQLYENSHRFASRRARAIRRAGGSADEHYVETLVQDIISDTATGVVTWDRSAKTLQEHVWDVIRTRTYHDRRRAERYEHEPLDISDPEASGDLLGEIETALEAHEGATDLELDGHGRELAALRAQCEADTAVLRVIEAFQSGATTSADIRQLTGLSDHEYTTARRRLRDHVNKMFPRTRSRRSRLKKGA